MKKCTGHESVTQLKMPRTALTENLWVLNGQISGFVSIRENQYLSSDGRKKENGVKKARAFLF